MKIEFANADRTLVEVTRGSLWWKRRATLRRMTRPEYDATSGISWWRFQPSERVCDYELSRSIDDAREAIAAQAREDADWQPITKPPVARLLKEAP